MAIPQLLAIFLFESLVTQTEIIRLCNHTYGANQWKLLGSPTEAVDIGASETVSG